MNKLLLVEPSKEYQTSFEKYVTAYKSLNDEYYYDMYKKALVNFDEYINKLNKFSKGINLPLGLIIISTFWLIDNGEIVGVTRVRHQGVETAGNIDYDISPLYRNRGYGTKILNLILEKAKEIGLNDVVLLCTLNNIASKKIIEKNNGKFLEVVFDAEDNKELYKYRIINNKD